MGSDPETFHIPDTPTLSVSVLEAIAEYEGGDPMSLDFTLNDYIDPEILDDLERSGMSKWSLSFIVGPYAVEVDYRDVITVDDRESFEELVPVGPGDAHSE